MSVRRNLSTPESRGFWAGVDRIARAVAMWPAWKRGQRTFCYCPGWGESCRNELVACGLSPFRQVDGLVVYDCGKCGTESRWLFDAPAPLLIEAKHG